MVVNGAIAQPHDRLEREVEGAGVERAAIVGDARHRLLQHGIEPVAQVADREVALGRAHEGVDRVDQRLAGIGLVEAGGLEVEGRRAGRDVGPGRVDRPQRLDELVLEFGHVERAPVEQAEALGLEPAGAVAGDRVPPQRIADAVGDLRGRRRVEALAQALEPAQVEQRQLAVAPPAVDPQMALHHGFELGALQEAGAGIAGRHGFARRHRPQAQVAQACVLRQPAGAQHHGPRIGLRRRE